MFRRFGKPFRQFIDKISKAIHSYLLCWNKNKELIEKLATYYVAMHMCKLQCFIFSIPTISPPVLLILNETRSKLHVDRRYFLQSLICWKSSKLYILPAPSEVPQLKALFPVCKKVNMKFWSKRTGFTRTSAVFIFINLWALKIETLHFSTNFLSNEQYSF